MKGSYYAVALSSKLFSCKQRFDERPECHTSVHRCGKNIYHCFVWDTNKVAECQFSEVSILVPVSEGTHAYLRINKNLYHGVSCCPFLFPQLLLPQLLLSLCLRFSGFKIYSHLLQLLLVTGLLIILAGMLAQLLHFFHKTSLGTEVCVLMTVRMFSACTEVGWVLLKSLRQSLLAYRI